MKIESKIEKLVRQAAKNNSLAQRQLYTRFYKPMLGLCIRLISDRYIAEDILQSGFLKALTKLSKLKDPKKFDSWLRQIMANECMDFLKSTIHFEDIDNITIKNEEEKNNWYESVSLDQINKEIDRLPDGCRQILVLYLLEEYKQREIAEKLKISVSTVKSQYQYALKMLKSNIKESIDESL